jgi:hypothetical protein
MAHHGASWRGDPKVEPILFWGLWWTYLLGRGQTLRFWEDYINIISEVYHAKWCSNHLLKSNKS